MALGQKTQARRLWIGGGAKVGIGLCWEHHAGRKEMPSSKRLFLALGFLDCVKARLDPSPFLCPQGLWLWLGDTTDIKRAQDDSVILGFFGMVVVVGVGNGG